MSLGRSSVEALFTSQVGGVGLRDRILSVIRDSAALAGAHHVDVHIMTFSFTDAEIAALLARAARDQPNLSIRLIADWNQGAEGYKRKVRALSALGLPNLEVRYKKDQPYVWDSDASRMRWSYDASRGLLHHKTLAVLVDGRPQTLLAGSFNWSTRSAKAYENLIVLTADTPASTRVMTAIEREFEALWSDGAATLSPDEVRAHYAAILAEYQSDAACAAADVVGMARGAGAPIDILRDADLDDDAVDYPHAQIAFSSRTAEQSEAAAGYAEANRRARFEMSKPSGKRKQVPVTLSTLALDTIARAQPGEHLLVAMYALSVRVPEYSELLAAARRGVRVFVVLDGHAGVRTLSRLAATAYGTEKLPIHLRATGRKVMHQKYIIHPEGRTVLTGTANLSTDASDRHSEHRLLWRGDQRATDAFVSDFETMWQRLAPPLASRTSAGA
jgi:phosphatidylserine/phosphatidylglycerophosphate/cardiolipin synthase-like enzyme